MQTNHTNLLLLTETNLHVLGSAWQLAPLWLQLKINRWKLGPKLVRIRWIVLFNDLHHNNDNFHPNRNNNKKFCQTLASSLCTDYRGPVGVLLQLFGYTWIWEVLVVNFSELLGGKYWLIYGGYGCSDSSRGDQIKMKGDYKRT